MRIPVLLLLCLAVTPVAFAMEYPHSSLEIGTHASEDMTMPNKAAQKNMSPIMQVQEDYICPMHTHIHGQKGGTCPICGMTLIPALKAQDHTGQQGSVNISPAYQQSLGVKIEKVAMQDFGTRIKAYGRIVHSTRHEYDVALRSDGWIVDLKADAVGNRVKKGDLLFTLYSEDIISAQVDYISGRKGSFLTGAAFDQRLLLSGMDDKAVDAFKKRGQIMRETPFYAPTDGTVTILNARKGSFIKAGDVALQLHDFSEVWVEASVLPQFLPQITGGGKATVSIPSLNKTYETTVDTIYPVLDEQNQTGTIRLVLSNLDGALKPDTYVDVSFETDKHPRLSVVERAVLRDKSGKYVLRVLKDGYFSPARVETGMSSGGKIEILSGLIEGEAIVASGQFMIDAESSLQNGMGAMNHE